MKDTYKDAFKLIGLSIGNLANKLIEDTADYTKRHQTKIKKAYQAYKDEPKTTKTITIYKDN